MCLQLLRCQTNNLLATDVKVLVQRWQNKRKATAAGRRCSASDGKAQSGIIFIDPQSGEIQF